MCSIYIYTIISGQVLHNKQDITSHQPHKASRQYSLDRGPLPSASLQWPANNKTNQSLILIPQFSLFLIMITILSPCDARLRFHGSSARILVVSLLRTGAARACYRR